MAYSKDDLYREIMATTARAAAISEYLRTQSIAAPECYRLRSQLAGLRLAHRALLDIFLTYRSAETRRAIMRIRRKAEAEGKICGDFDFYAYLADFAYASTDELPRLYAVLKAAWAWGQKA